MPNEPQNQYKEKFRPDDSALDKEVEAALGDLKLDEMMDASKPLPGGGEAGTGMAPAGPGPHPPGLAGGHAGGHAAGHGSGRGVRRGRIVRIDSDDVFVDFGGKSQGIANIQQFDKQPAVGDELEFNVDRYDPSEGLLILTRKGAAASKVSWESLEVGQIVEGNVIAMNKGGLEVDVKGIRAFMPAGQVDIVFQKDISTFIGQKITAEVTQFDRGAKNVILSRRNILEREKEVKRQQLLTELAEGQVRRGTVRNVMDFGAFVDLGGVDGLLHVSEMSFRRGRQNANEFVKVGDVMDVKVVRIDHESGKISLSLKQARGIDPWADAGSKYAVGSTVTGRVVKVENFGAFIEVEEGVEGLLPISEMSYQRVRAASDVVKEGDTLKLVVLRLDTTEQKITFSLKQAGPDPWARAGERYAVDTIVTGRVTRAVDFGAFVELEPGLEGLVHISELSDRPVRSSGDAVKSGQEVQVRILDVNPEGRRISLSIRRAKEIAPPPPPPEGAKPAAAAAAKKKKRPELRGGLDF